MSLRWRLALGVLALWGTLYAFGTLAMDLALVPLPTHERSTEGEALGPLFILASALNAILVLLIFAFIAIRSERLRAGEKVGWIFAMMFFYPLVVPPFWYLHIWRSPA